MNYGDAYDEPLKMSRRDYLIAGAVILLIFALGAAIILITTKP